MATNKSADIYTSVKFKLFSLRCVALRCAAIEQSPTKNVQGCPTRYYLNLGFILQSFFASLKASVGAAPKDARALSKSDCNARKCQSAMMTISRVRIARFVLGKCIIMLVLCVDNVFGKHVRLPSTFPTPFLF
jgi:hypothetical protein